MDSGPATPAGPDWDEFWRERAPSPAGESPIAPQWADLVWARNLAHWDEIFSRRCPGRRLLEVGCGSGRVSRHMARRGYRCSLLDRSVPAIELARRNFAAEGLEAQFVIGEMAALPFPDGSFDGVYCGGVLEFIDDLSRPLREIARVLRPGGVFAATVVPNKFSCQTIGDWQQGLVRLARRFGGSASAAPADAMRHVSRRRLADYREAWRAAGLVAVEGRGTLPFPALALGASGGALYAAALRRLGKLWDRFDRSDARWTEWWGLSYVIHGSRPPAPAGAAGEGAPC